MDKMVNKKLGQHFLIDKSVAKREISYATLDSNDTVLEIGPGKGILTQLLAQKVKQVIAIEIDSNLISHLKQLVPDNVLLINADVLDIDYHELPTFNKIVANLPFQISSPITFKFLTYPFQKAILIYQKDFAERMIARPRSKEYSRLSVGIYYKTHCSMLEQIPRTCFYPVPQVDSSIVKLIPRDSPPFNVINEDFFFEVTKKLFAHRRKTIRTILRSQYLKVEQLPYLQKRVEELTPEQIGEVSDLLYTLHY
jgi:16S rRNA (adenine1518-N6/adenine1519-N6)-dimethyltransferase